MGPVQVFQVWGLGSIGFRVLGFRVQGDAELIGGGGGGGCRRGNEVLGVVDSAPRVGPPNLGMQMGSSLN